MFSLDCGIEHSTSHHSGRIETLKHLVHQKKVLRE